MQPATRLATNGQRLFNLLCRTPAPRVLLHPSSWGTPTPLLLGYSYTPAPRALLHPSSYGTPTSQLLWYSYTPAPRVLLYPYLCFPQCTFCSIQFLKYFGFVTTSTLHMECMFSTEFNLFGFDHLTFGALGKHVWYNDSQLNAVFGARKLKMRMHTATVDSQTHVSIQQDCSYK